MNTDLSDTRILDSENPLQTHYVVRGIRLPTRFFLAPINTGFFCDGVPTDGLRDFHQERSGKGIGISYVGNVAIHCDCVTTPETAYLSEHKAWSLIAQVIRNNGSAAGIQLACKIDQDVASRKWLNHDIAEFFRKSRVCFASIPANAIAEILDRFVRAAELARRQGFQVIQLHAAHGYFLAQLLSPEVNQRDDRYVDGIEVFRHLVERIRTSCPDIVIDVRLSMTEGLHDQSRELSLFGERVDRIAQSQVDIISLSDGFYGVDRFRIYPRFEDGLACNLARALVYSRAHPHKIWNVGGNIWTIRPLVGALTTNLTLSIGRSLIADPLFIEKHLNNQADAVRCCIRSGHCHYFTRNRRHIECKVNERLAGMESRLDLME
jgi:2,4-dienoyl-CoA reductase-like NADH-dependent reductase (Old Yellow Enzyme family)